MLVGIWSWIRLPRYPASSTSTALVVVYPWADLNFAASWAAVVPASELFERYGIRHGRCQTRSTSPNDTLTSVDA